MNEWLHKKEEDRIRNTIIRVDTIGEIVESHLRQSGHVRGEPIEALEMSVEQVEDGPVVRGAGFKRKYYWSKY